MQFLYLTKYIHRNPLKLIGNNPNNLVVYPYSSYPNYLNLIDQSWVDPQNITYRYSPKNTNNQYKSFVEETNELATEITTMGELTLDWETYDPRGPSPRIIMQDLDDTGFHPQGIGKLFAAQFQRTSRGQVT